MMEVHYFKPNEGLFVLCIVCHEMQWSVTVEI